VEEVKPEPQKIIPAKIISREAPRYPSRALKNSIQGWVQVRFFIDTDGRPADVSVIASEPGDTFDDAATKSVKKWRFSPARNQTTGLAVRSTSISTKVQFRLD
jgi:protein TonB